MAKVLVTGASGFIGTHLTEALVARGDEVTCLVRHTSQVDRLRRLDVRLLYGDLTDPESLQPAVSGNCVVYHLAGATRMLRAADFYRVNAQGTANVARTCAQQAQPPVLVFVSSLAAAGPAPGGRPRVETDRPVQVSEYGRSKRAGELAAQQFAGRVPVTIVRPPIVFGPMDRVGLTLFQSVDRLGVHLVPGLSRCRFSLIYAADLVQLLVLAAERGARLRSCANSGSLQAQGYYFAACEMHPAYPDLGRMIGAALGRRRVLSLPVATPMVWLVAAGAEIVSRATGEPLYLNLDKAHEATAGSWICSPQAAIEQLGFSVAAPLHQRLRQTAQWYRAAGWL